ncbi:hypothetical protein BDR03DRAFT_1016918 [Suillus americanus]|nr:hypothetical protein BDR03DRAFT_1016918 [Suillus americanus]
MLVSKLETVIEEGGKGVGKVFLEVVSTAPRTPIHNLHHRTPSHTRPPRCPPLTTAATAPEPLIVVASESALKLEIGLKSDEIKKLALERSATYRKCRLEDIKLSLLEGNLKNVPMEENLQEEDNSPETTAEFDVEISKLNREIERMAPNQAIKNDVKAKLADTEKEADKAQKDSQMRVFVRVQNEDKDTGTAPKD